jgi:hypothetical protein
MRPKIRAQIAGGFAVPILALAIAVVEVVLGFEQTKAAENDVLLKTELRARARDIQLQSALQREAVEPASTRYARSPPRRRSLHGNYEARAARSRQRLDENGTTEREASVVASRRVRQHVEFSPDGPDYPSFLWILSR